MTKGSKALNDAGIAPNGLCHCGCGEEPSEGHHFCHGHDARFFGALLGDPESAPSVRDGMRIHVAGLFGTA